jgi:hypothetical protein
VRSCLLRGREFPRLGAIDLVAEQRVAAGISAGGARKLYPHVNPNEDAAAFAIGAGGMFLAVADGHGGFEASEIALDHLLENPALQWTEPGGVSPESWQRHALAALLDLNATILRETKPERNAPPRTTLVLALVRPQEGGLFFATVGDSHLFVSTRKGVEDVAGEPASSGGPFFLGHGPETLASLAGKSSIGTLPLAGVRAVVLATDGISESGVGLDHPELEVAEQTERVRGSTPEMRAPALARGILEAALTAHGHHESGDNIATAVAWLED